MPDYRTYLVQEEEQLFEEQSLKQEAVTALETVEAER